MKECVLASRSSEGASSRVGGLMRTASRTVRFAGGFLSGILVLPVLGLLGLAAMLAWVFAVDSLPSRTMADPWVEVRGADLSAAGAASVTVETETDTLRVDCRGGCDDLVADNQRARRLQIRNAQGECIACSEQGALPWFLKPPKTWRAEGLPLAIREGGAS